ncbi:MAG: hypothetical protein EOP88_02855 [Verrucomicrobiaceae bacterium]|nr:MAG: hypothetical protein EOP88_02855 [Verrucomicrobiaceae bacterium]
MKSGSPIVPVEGANVAVFNAGNSVNNGSLTQNVPVTPGLLNRLELHAGNLSYNTQQQRLRVRVHSRSGNNFQSLVDQVITINGLGGGKTNWQAAAFEFTSAFSPVEVIVSDFSLTTNSLDLVLDRVRLAPVYQVNVGASAGGAPVAAEITALPGDVGGAGVATTPYLRKYLEGTAVTFTAPAVAGGYPFNGWRQDGVSLGNDRQVTVMVDANTTLEAVYVAGHLVMTPLSPLETSGVAGSGPFLPSGETRTLTNLTPSGATWFIEPKVNFDAPLADWVTISPTTGFIASGQQVPVNISINQAAKNLPVGLHKAVFELITPFGSNQYITILLTANGSSVFANGGFESDFAGWTVSGNVSVQSAAPYGPTERSKLAAFNAANSPPNGSLRRAVVTLPGRRYRLEFDAGNLSYNSLRQRMQVDVTEVVGTATQTHVHDLLDIPGPGGGATAWVAGSYEFTAVGNSVSLVFADVSQATNALDLVLDRVRVSEVLSASVANGGFESGLDEWTATGNVVAKTGAPYAPTGGTGLAVFNSSNSAPNGSLSQLVHLAGGEPCRLEFDVGNLSYNTLPQRMHVLVQGRFGSEYFTLVDKYIEIGGPGGGATAWQSKFYDFVPGTGAVLITFTDISPSTNSTDLVLDRVRVSQ